MNLYPKAYFLRVENISAKFLEENNIKALILDVDNTLIDYEKKLSEEVKQWVKDIKNRGIKLYILSNSNKTQKVKNVADELQIKFKNFAKKPLKTGFLEIQKELKEKVEEIGVVGDQIFTDIIGGNRCNMFTILVEPINKKDYWYTAWKRPIEEKLKRKIELTK